MESITPAKLSICAVLKTDAVLKTAKSVIPNLRIDRRFPSLLIFCCINAVRTLVLLNIILKAGDTSNLLKSERVIVTAVVSFSCAINCFCPSKVTDRRVSWLALNCHCQRLKGIREVKLLLLEKHRPSHCRDHGNATSWINYLEVQKSCYIIYQLNLTVF